MEQITRRSLLGSLAVSPLLITEAAASQPVTQYEINDTLYEVFESRLVDGKLKFVAYKTTALGIQRWFNEKGEYHRIDGPAVIWADSSQTWYQSGKVHRVGGPAIVYKDGGEEWWEDGFPHRLNDLPAVIRPDGYRAWYQNGLFHRIGAPAVIYPHGVKEWWLNGQRQRRIEEPQAMNQFRLICRCPGFRRNLTCNCSDT